MSAQGTANSYPISLKVFTFKAGILARLAHDLRLNLGNFEIELRDGQLKGWFDLSSWKVDGVMRHGQLDPAGLRDHDKTQVVETVQGQILQTGQFPRAELSGRLRQTGPTSWTVDGTLQLRGRSLPQTCSVELAGMQIRAHSELVPSRFGIAPYAALGGGIRLQDRVLLTAESQLTGSTLEAILTDPNGVRFRPMTDAVSDGRGHK